MTITAKVIADSISYDNRRITTLQLRYPRFIHEDFMTHRMFSRNASSSRAKPSSRWIQEIREDCAMPIYWGKNKSGMQAGEELDEELISILKLEWLLASRQMGELAKFYEKNGLHKQHSNRILHPFQHIDVVVTATEWDNFFALRISDEAQPEIKKLAEEMANTMVNSKARELDTGEWHLPYVTESEKVSNNLSSLKLVSAARCARVSYSNHDGTKCDISKDIQLAEMLLKSYHMSPFEHQATPMSYNALDAREWQDYEGITHTDRFYEYWSGNFRGWIQYRQLCQ